jgi:dihydrofolate reductase
MTRCVYYSAATLDGYIAEADDTIDWLTSYEGSYDGDAPPVDGGYEEFYEEVGALVMGSVTYAWILGDMERTGSGWAYPGKPCWVLSSRDLPVPDGDRMDVRIVNSPVADLYAEMGAAAGHRALWVVGGGNVASQFADSGLLDEVRVTVVPVVLAGGKPLFERRPPGRAMQLEAVQPRRNGMVELRYAITER